MTPPFPHDGGRAGDGGAGTTSPASQGNAELVGRKLHRGVSEPDTDSPAITSILDPSPIEGDGRVRGNWTWITPALLIGGEVWPDEWPALAAAGVRAVVDLRDEAVDDAEALAALAIAHLHLPTPDHHPPSPEALDRGVAFARGAGPVLLHCREGVGRSATLALCVLVDRGDAPLAALDRAKDARWQVSPSPAQFHAWAAWLQRRGIAPPAFDAFAAVAYRHLRPA